MARPERPALTRDYVRGILVSLIAQQEQLRPRDVSDATRILEKKILYMLYARLSLVESAIVQERQLEWREDWTVEGVLAVLGLQNGGVLNRKEPRGRKRKGREKLADD